VNALYLIFKFAVAHRQSFDDDMRALPHIQACRKQTRTNLNLCMTPFERCDFTLATGGKSTQKERLQGTSWVEDFSTQLIFYGLRTSPQNFRTTIGRSKLATFWPTLASTSQIAKLALAQDQTNNASKQIKLRTMCFSVRLFVRDIS